MKTHWLAATALAAIGILPGFLTSPTLAKSSLSGWREYPAPVIEFGQAIPYLLWNDPTVLKEGSGYRMWLSGGDPRDLRRIPVDVYSAMSRDGISWTIDLRPAVTAKHASSDWDNLRIETPSVVIVDGTYHMYYSGASEADARVGIYSIGHATSTDGLSWTKDPANPVLRAQITDPTRWGFGTIAEPAIVYNPANGIFYLYYVGMRFVPADPPIGQIGVLLATSSDGSRFKDYVDPTGERALIHGRDVPGAPPGAWFGYTAPSVVIGGDGQVHMFSAFIVGPVGPHSARHVSLTHAVSKNGIVFELVEQDFIKADGRDWKDHQVRSPAALENDGNFELWFAGETVNPVFGAGIGYARQFSRDTRGPGGTTAALRALQRRDR